jgi:predicted TIM-barrel fold metal-dependent hydrolase
MSTAKFTNVHLHVFNATCVPKNFLRILPKKTIRKIAPYVLNLLSTWAGRKIIFGLAKIGASKDPIQRKSVDKYIGFLHIGLQKTQQEVFELDYDVIRAEDAEARMVALTINMDYMDEEVPPMNYRTQIADVKNIKRYYPTAFYPMYGIDPRHLSGENGLAILKKEMESVLVHNDEILPYFCGLKLYPALGYFPFDQRLQLIYAYAEKNCIPLMSHCTRVGSQYIGATIESLIPKDLSLVYPSPIADATDAATKLELEGRIKKYYERGWIKNSKIGDNDYACDLFGHPQNYIPILIRFPKLKICLAHMGGSTEIDTQDSDASVKEIRLVADPQLWFDRLIDMMVQYEQLYTDISYTLSAFCEEKSTVLKRTLALMRTKDKNGKELAYRVLFGTDFFMTEQEMREAELIALAKSKLSTETTLEGDNYWVLLTKANVRVYLGM